MTHRFPDLEGCSSNPGRTSGDCPACFKHTSLTRHSHTLIDGSEDESGAGVYEMLLTCDWCKKQSIYLRTARRTSRAAGGAQRVWVYETVDLEQVWPKPAPRQLAPEAPSAVREVFSEAALAEAGGAMRLAGVGYRSVVEQIVKERGAPGKNLKAMIAALSGMGVPQSVVDAFDEARAVGNDAVHDGLSYSAEEIADLAELIQETVLILYVQPAQRAKMAAARASRRAAAKQSTP
ncbi:DUF4145 domain-containing protein [Streptomyces platensis]|uniref:DUF4145 domain-containing protein n=1 Tax=Streptomyces platensis TaxID=58346 RepID=UPI0033C50441